MYYKKIEEDCTFEHEQTINNCIDDLVMNGEIQHDVAKLLKPSKSRTSIFYMLPKIHKINNPGRPVIASVNSHTGRCQPMRKNFKDLKQNNYLPIFATRQTLFKE